MVLEGLVYYIRQAMLKDIDSLCTMLKQFSKHYSTHFPPFKDQETSRRILKNMIENHVFYVAVTGDHMDIVGLIAGFVCDHPYNPDIKTLAEAFWYVAPEYRESGVGKDLLDIYEDWGVKNVDWILMTIEEDTKVPHSVFLNRGYKPKEISFIKEIV